MAVSVAEAAAVMRAMTCCGGGALPSTHVLRLVALHVGAHAPRVLRARESKRLSALGLTRDAVSMLFRAFPDAESCRRLDAARDLFMARLPARHVKAALAAWGADGARRVAEDPYGAMFELKAPLEEADAVAAAVSGTTSTRPAEHAKWLLRVFRREGHTAVPTATVVARVAASCDMPVDEVRRALADAVDRRALALAGAGDGECVVDPEILKAEAFVAAEVAKRTRVSWADAPDVPDLCDEQRLAVDTIFSRALTIMTGGPGTGKSTVVRALVRAVGEDRCMLTAPTGRAARNVGGSTVHSASGGRLLRRRPLQETTRADVPDDLLLLVVDEASMLTTELAVGVFNLVPERCHVVLVGDADQLPPVGAGNVFKDLLASGTVPTATLTHNHRSVSGVQRLAADILRGECGGAEVVHAATRDAGMRAVTRLVAQDPARQVLTPHNATRHVLNRALQSTLRDVPIEMKDGGAWGLPRRARGTMRTHGPSGVAEIAFDDRTLSFPVDQALTVTAPRQAAMPGDAVMVLKNQNKRAVRPGECSACNGDVGTLVRLSPKAVVKFGELTSEFPSFDAWLTLAYAATVHKFQGSECEEVVLPIYDPAMWDRHMLYTAVTRARGRVHLVGTAADLRAIVARRRPSRHSALVALLSPPPR